MRIIALSFTDIHFERTAFEESLRDSIDRRGLAFPVKVSIRNNEYFCVDGHKRLSVLESIYQKDPLHRYVKSIPVIVVNSDLNRSNDCWRSRNTH